jgi:hypothetical protein
VLYEGPAAQAVGNKGERHITPINLRPNEKRSFQVVLSTQSSAPGSSLQPLFAEPGTFGLRFSYPVSYQEDQRSDSVVVHSQRTGIQVKEPSAEQARALEDLKRTGRAGAILNSTLAVTSLTLAEQVEWENALIGFLNEHPNSYWTPMVHLALATLYEHRGLEPSGTKDVVLLQRAISHLDSALVAGDLPYTAQTQVRRRALAGILQKASDQDEGARAAQPDIKVPAETQVAVERALTALVNAIRSADKARLQELLDTSFRYNATLDREKFLQEFSQTFQKLENQSLEVQSTLTSLLPQGDEAVATVRLRLVVAEKDETQVVRFTFGQSNNQWRVRKWDRLSTRRGNAK